METEKLNLEISDAISEKLDVRYTIKTKTILPAYDGTEFTVERSHNEFVWLFSSLLENPNHMGPRLSKYLLLIPVWLS